MGDAKAGVAARKTIAAEKEDLILQACQEMLSSSNETGREIWRTWWKYTLLKTPRRLGEDAVLVETPSWVSSYSGRHRPLQVAQCQELKFEVRVWVSTQSRYEVAWVLER